MLWEVKISEAQSERFRNSNPPPEINSIIRLFVQSFFTLSTERSTSSNGIGMIPYSKIVEYGDWIEFEDITRFLKVIQRVDAEYVDVFYKKLEANSKK